MNPKNSLLSKICFYGGFTLLIFYSLVKGSNSIFYLKKNSPDQQAQTQTRAQAQTRAVVVFVGQDDLAGSLEKENIIESIDNQKEGVIQTGRSERPIELICKNRELIYNSCIEKFSRFYYDFKLDKIHPQLRIIVDDYKCLYCRVDVPYKDLSSYDSNVSCLDFSKTKQGFFSEILETRYPSNIVSFYNKLTDETKISMIRQYQTIKYIELENSSLYEDLINKFERLADYYFYLLRLNEVLSNGTQFNRSEDVSNLTLEDIISKGKKESLNKKIELQKTETQEIFNQLKKVFKSYQEYDKDFESLDVIFISLLKQKTYQSYSLDLEKRRDQQIQSFMVEQALTPAPASTSAPVQEAEAPVQEAEAPVQEAESSLPRFRWIRRALNYGTPIVAVSLIGIRLIIFKF